MPGRFDIPLSRRSLLGGVGVGVVGASVGLPAMASAATRGAEFRLGSFNIHHGASPDDVLDLERVAAQLELMECDVLGLQEVDRFWKRSDYVDEPAWFAERLGVYVVFGANLDLDPEGSGKPRREYGTAILSRWPITESENTLLPVVDGHEQRGLLRAVVDAPDGPLTFATTHLSHQDAAERVAQAEAIIEVLGDKPRRTVLVGDFNAPPGDEAITTVTDRLADTWATVGEGDGLTYPSVKPTGRIDYLFASKDLRPEAMTVDAEDPEASDHLPISGQYGAG